MYECKIEKTKYLLLTKYLAILGQLKTSDFDIGMSYSLSLEQKDFKRW